jgi:lysophospholipase L1-like esterase
MLPRGPTYEATRSTYNGLIRANWRQFADVLVDVAADPNIGVAGANSNTTYFDPDAIHLNNTGYAIVATLVKATLGLQ